MSLEKFANAQSPAQPPSQTNRKQLISELQKYMRVDSPFAVKFKKPPAPYREKPGLWFEMRVSDSSGELTVRYWGSVDAEKTKQAYNSFSNGDVVWITGTVKESGEYMEIHIGSDVGDTIRKCAPGEFSIDEFVPSLPLEMVEKNVSEFNRIIRTVKNPEIMKVLEAFFADPSFMEKFKWAPGAMQLHHAYRGGLLEHTIHVARICISVSELYPELDRDLMVAGALLHDIGKTVEYEVGTSIDVSEEGMLRGHVVIGEEMLRARCQNIDPLVKLKLSHVILSHHKEGEYGSPKKPQLPESMVIYFADDCDAKAYQMLRIKETAKTEDAWAWDKHIGHVYLK
ncbi:MAG: HD domain-containing protein [Candidatus Thermoplasmatota archaeon]|nr:HD domain-containing protein [Candidatus Thermoplasmatota archaeon]